MSTFYDDIQNITTLAAEDEPCLITMLRNSIRSAALMGKTEDKSISKCELLDLANLIEEGFEVDVKLDVATQSYPSLSVKVGWKSKVEKETGKVKIVKE